MYYLLNKRINIFTGHFGSGKTEVAVNYAFKLSNENNKTAIVDLDIVNPYFRTADARADLEEKGIKVVSSIYANTNVDVPALPAEISTYFEDKSYKVVLDIGGDDLGAKAISRYKDEILSDDFGMFFVINTKRPWTNTVDKIKEMIRLIEETAGIKTTGLVNNTNLLQQTTSEDILEGHRLIEKVSKDLNIPFAFISGPSNSISEKVKKLGLPILYLEKYINMP